MLAFKIDSIQFEMYFSELYIGIMMLNVFINQGLNVNNLN